MNVALPFVLLLLLFAQVDHQFPENHIEGILEAPEIFGDYPCDRYEPQPVTVYAGPSPDSTAMGTLEVLRPWYLNESSPCEAIQIGFQQDATSEPEPIVFREHGYEEAGLIVVERRDDWFGIELSSGTGWIQASSPERFHSYVELVTESLAYVNRGWPGLLWPTPGVGTPREIREAWRSYTARELTIDVLEGHLVDEELWFRIKIDPESACGELPEDLPTDEGWVPGYRTSGENLIWFYSRGC